MPLFYHKYVNYVLAHSVNYVITLYKLAPPVASNLSIPTIIVKGQHTLAQHNVLASLVKGRWIDGKAQTVTLLRFICDTSAFFIRQTFCRQDGGIATPLRSAPTLPKAALSLAFRNANICMHLYAFISALSHPLFVWRGACPSRCTTPRPALTLPKPALSLSFRVVSVTAPLPTKIKSAPVFTGANSSSH